MDGWPLRGTLVTPVKALPGKSGAVSRTKRSSPEHSSFHPWKPTASAALNPSVCITTRLLKENKTFVHYTRILFRVFPHFCVQKLQNLSFHAFFKRGKGSKGHWCFDRSALHWFVCVSGLKAGSLFFPLLLWIDKPSAPMTVQSSVSSSAALGFSQMLLSDRQHVRLQPGCVCRSPRVYNSEWLTATSVPLIGNKRAHSLWMRREHL